MARVLEAVLTLALAWCAFAAGPDGASGYVETGECEVRALIVRNP